jgi:hypothetical protein
VFNKTKSEIIGKYIPIDNERAAFMNFIEARNFNRKPAYFSQTYNPYIYEMSESKITDSVFLDFGKQNIPESELNKSYADVREFSQSMQNSGFVYGLSNILMNEDILVASANQNGEQLQFYADLKKKSSSVFDKIENDVFGINKEERITYDHRPLAITDSHIYMMVNIELQNEIFQDLTVINANQDDLNNELLRKIENFEEGDNLAIVKLKI